MLEGLSVLIGSPSFRFMKGLKHMTIKQKQCLLQFLGYYDGVVDGVWGAKSTAATKAFQQAHGLVADGVAGDETQKAMKKAVAEWVSTGNSTTNTTPDATTPTDGTTNAATGDFWDEIKHFKKSEFACKCGGKYCNGYPADPKEKLIRAADDVREHFGKSMFVSSGLRCKQHNANVGGVSNSRHLSGKAMDFCISGVSAAQILSYVKQKKEIRYAYAIDGSYVHMDIE